MVFSFQNVWCESDLPEMADQWKLYEPGVETHLDFSRPATMYRPVRIDAFLETGDHPYF